MRQANTKDMPMNKDITWDKYVAVSTASIAVLAAIATLHAGTNSSHMLLEKNNANLYQNQANTEWNSYLAQKIESFHGNTDANNVATQMQMQKDLQDKTTALDTKVAGATNKAQVYFEKNSILSTAGTFLEVAIALSAMSVLIKKKYFWIFSLLLAGVGVYFLVL